MKISKKRTYNSGNCPVVIDLSLVCDVGAVKCFCRCFLPNPILYVEVETYSEKHKLSVTSDGLFGPEELLHKAQMAPAS